MKRSTWTEYFMGLAKHISTRSTCLRRRAGAVAVRDRRILATGYNGAPAGLRHCAEVGCLREELGVPSGQRHELCRAVHAEQNVITQAARFGIPLDGAGICIVGGTPCSLCVKMMINVGIAWIVCEGHYADEMALEMLQEANIPLENV